VHLGPDNAAIDIVDHALGRTQKWHNVIRNPLVAFIVDTMVSVHPPDARGIEIRGTATALRGAGTTEDASAHRELGARRCGHHRTRRGRFRRRREELPLTSAAWQR
jgi:hypothetical protein